MRDWCTFLASIYFSDYDCRLSDSETGEDLLSKEDAHIQFVDAKYGYYVSLDNKNNLSVCKNPNLVLTKGRWNVNGEYEVVSVYDAKVERQKASELAKVSCERDKNKPSLTITEMGKMFCEATGKDKFFIRSKRDHG